MSNITISSRYNQSQKQTESLSDDYIYTKPVSRSIADLQALFVPTSRCVNLYILGMLEVIDFSKTPIVNLGRFDSYYGSTNTYTLDLTSFGAVERGVSRRHCRITLVNNQLVIMDLESTNGTFISDKRLPPNKPHVLKKGEKIALGRLHIQVTTEG